MLRGQRVIGQCVKDIQRRIFFVSSVNEQAELFDTLNFTNAVSNLQDVWGMIA